MSADLDHRPGADAAPAILRLTPVPTALRTVGTIGLAMIPIHRLPRSVQIASVLGPAALATGLIIRAQRRAIAEARDEETADPVPAAEPTPDEETSAPTDAETDQANTGPRWVPILVLSGAMGAALAGATYAGIRIDRGTENALRRRSVPAPRLVMGLASGALSLGMDVLDARSKGPDRR